MKKWVKRTILTSLLLWSGAGYAACPRTSACISYPAVTKWTTGETVAADVVVSYEIYRQGTAGPRITTKALSVELQRQPAGRQCYYMVAIFSKDGVDYVSSPSAITDKTCKLIRSAAPTDGAIERPTDGALEPK